METAETTDSDSQTSAKNHVFSIPPPEFWENLSKVPLCRRALREFNRRTVRPVLPNPPVRSILKGDLIKPLKRFARHGGPNLRNMRGYAASNAVGVPTPVLTIRDAAFTQALIDQDYYPVGYATSPSANHEWTKERLRARRPSLSLDSISEEKFQDFVRKALAATSEAAVRSDVFPIIRGENTTLADQSHVFNHLEPLAEFITRATPNYYYGALPAQLNRKVRSELGTYIVPCNNPSRPLLANHFTEVSGPAEVPVETSRKMLQNLGHGARAMLKVQSYGQNSPNYDGKAYTIGVSYSSASGIIYFYLMHPVAPEQPGGNSRFYMTQIRAIPMDNDRETFIEGATWYRNSIDLAKEYRDAAIEQANRVSATRDAEVSETPSGPA